MPEFLSLLPPSIAMERFLSIWHPHQQKIDMPVEEAAGYVIAEDVIAPLSLPSFPRSTVDGFAVRAVDTFGASDALPAYLRVVKEIPMGETADFALGVGECALIHTGGMMPQNADAVVMVENTQRTLVEEIEVHRPVAVGENVLAVGEEVQQGEKVLTAGKRLRPQEIGGLMALGITQIQVARPPMVGLISCGDEIVPPQAEVRAGLVRDINSYSLSALVKQAGGLPLRFGIVRDDAQALFQSASEALVQCDLVVISAGSSASTRDVTAQVINALGPPGVLVHGVSVQPGKPTILGVCDEKAVLGLPGNPMSAFVVALLFLKPMIEKFLGLLEPATPPLVKARLSLNLASQSGREDWIGVRLQKTLDGYEAHPILGRSNFIFSLVRADGLIRIPAEATGFAAGEEVEVFLLMG